MISQVKIIDRDFQSRAGVETVTFQPGINLLVGANGSGKSSLLGAIQREIRDNDQRTARLTRDASVPVKSYIGEEATSRKDASADSMSLAQINLSHGQRLQAYLAGLNNMVGEQVVLMDEPEMALDFFAVYELCSSMLDRPDIQFIVSTHHPLFFTFLDANFINMDRTRPNYVKDVLKQLSSRLITSKRAK